MGLDFETLKNILNNNFETYITEWFPNAYRVNSTTWKTGDFNDTKAKKGDGSFAINIKDKYAKDFSTGEKAGDIISIYAKRFCNGDMGRAYIEFSERDKKLLTIVKHLNRDIEEFSYREKIIKGERTLSDVIRKQSNTTNNNEYREQKDEGLYANIDINSFEEVKSSNMDIL